MRNNGSNNKVPDIETVSFNHSGEIVNDSVFKRFFLLLVFVLISTLSFGLGRLSNEGERAGVRIDYDPTLGISTTSSVIIPKIEAQTQTTEAPLNTTSQEVVGSIKGTKYHYLYCSGARQISEANRITFKSAALAEAAVYTLALNCKQR